MRPCVPPKASRAPCGLAKSPLLPPSLCFVLPSYTSNPDSPSVPLPQGPALLFHHSYWLFSTCLCLWLGLKWQLSITPFPYPAPVSSYFLFLPNITLYNIFFVIYLLWNRNSLRTGALSDLFIAFSQCPEWCLALSWYSVNTCRLKELGLQNDQMKQIISS